MKKPFIYKFDLVRLLVWRDFVLRYKRSILGALWSLLSPLAQLLVLVFLFGRVIPLNIEAYPAFVFTALLPWAWFSSSLNSSAYLFIQNRDLVRRPNFEPSTLIIVNTLSHLIHYLIFLPILVVILALYSRPMTLHLFIFPLLLLVQGILTIGLSFIVATLDVFYHDVQYMTGMALTLLFYLTPVFYQPQASGEKYRIIYALNPISVLVQGYRGIFFYGAVPEFGPLLLTGAMSIFFLGLGYLVYNRQLSNVYDAL